MRKLFWRLHSITGLLAGLCLLVIGVTGSILVFHEEVDALWRPEAVRVEPAEDGRLSLRALVAAVESAIPDHAVTGWAFNRDNPRAADGAYVMPFGTRDWKYITVDPYRGEILSGPIFNESTFKGWLLDLHHTFFLHHFGMAVTGILGVALCFLGISGIWIYRRFWKTLFRLRWKASARMLYGDFHRMAGVFSVVFNLLLGFTGAYWNLTHVIGDLFWPNSDPADEAIFHEKLFSSELDLDGMLADAKQRVPGFQTHYVSLPWAPGGPFTLWGRPENAPWFRSVYGSQVTYASQDLSFLSSRNVSEDPFWSQVVDSFEPLHFGDFGGLPVKILWACAGLAPGVLAISGMAIWLRRRKPRLANVPYWLDRRNGRKAG